MSVPKSKIITCVLFLLSLTLVFAESGDLPDLAKTSGDLLIDPSTGKPAGRPKGSTKEIRDVSSGLKAAVFDEYKIDSAHRNGTDYEIDHLISLVLGGSNDIKNLWPQSRDRSREWNAWEKDKLEDKLYHLVDAGIVPLAEAQEAIRTDWIAAYEKYMPMNIHGHNDYRLVSGAVMAMAFERKPESGEPIEPKSRHAHYVLKENREVDIDPDGN